MSQRATTATTRHRYRREPSQPPSATRTGRFTLTGEDLRDMRRRVGLSQAELARRLSFSRAAVHLWESGARDIPQAHWQAILDTLTAARLEMEAWRQQVAQLRAGEGG